MYDWLRSHLKAVGYTVYPREIVIGMMKLVNPGHSFVLDVAARKHPYFYAFEYKSSGDRLRRAIKQIQNYRLSFDFVIVVAETPRIDMTSSTLARFKELGAGLWTVTGGEPPYKFEVIMEPVLQHPIPENREDMKRKFHLFVSTPKFGPWQHKITEYASYGRKQ